MHETVYGIVSLRCASNCLTGRPIELLKLNNDASIRYQNIYKLYKVDNYYQNNPCDCDEVLIVIAISYLTLLY